MSPTGVYDRKAGKKSGGGDAPAPKPPRAEGADAKHLITLPADIDARVQRAARADDRRTAVYLRRFIINNIDVIDPPEAED